MSTLTTTLACPHLPVGSLPAGLQSILFDFDQILSASATRGARPFGGDLYNILPENPAFQEVLSHTPHPMFVVDHGCRIIAANPAALVAYGYTKEQFVGMSVRDITHSSEWARLRTCFEHASPDVRATGRWKHLRKDGHDLIADITSYSLLFDNRRVRVVLSVDVTEQVQAEERTRQYVAKLEAALSSSVIALSRMVELRDPYTAEHQERVSRLAVELAREMKMDEDTQEGIAVMGLLHDIGKIGIPVDILSKPRSLSSAEYEVVKSHAQFGYNILVKLDFGWPVADCVLQHHERLDGSGYPNGLRASDIRIESRIVALADVIESISSHRPYRPGLGERKALEEVRADIKLYDPNVLEAAARLFGRGHTIQ